MEKHRTIAGALQIVQGCIVLLVAVLVFGGMFGGTHFADDPDVKILAGTVGTAIGAFLALLAVPFIVAGLGFIYRKSWSRPLLWIVAVVGLFVNVPVGTAIGAYTIWVLVKTGKQVHNPS